MLGDLKIRVVGYLTREPKGITSGVLGEVMGCRRQTTFAALKALTAQGKIRKTRERREAADGAMRLMTVYYLVPNPSPCPDGAGSIPSTDAVPGQFPCAGSPTKTMDGSTATGDPNEEIR